MALVTLTWPATLPQSPLVNTTRIRPVANKIVHQSDAGRVQQRQRYPVGHNLYTFSMLMSDAQWQILHDFYWGQCASGTRSFWHRDWTRGDTVQWFWHDGEESFEAAENTPVGWEIPFIWTRRRP